MSKNVVVAKILTSHGIRGYLKMESYIDNPKDIFNYSNDLYDVNNKKFKINFVGTIKTNIFIVKIDDINDMDVAKSWRNTDLYIDSSLLPSTNDNEFYYNDLIGLNAKTIDEKSQGIITSVDDYGAGTVVEIKWNDEKMEESIPFIKDYFKEINTEKGYVIIERPEYV